MNKYEGVIIALPNISREEIDKIVLEVKKIVTVENYEERGTKKLAYECKGYKDGYFMIFNILAEQSNVLELEKYFRQENLILKYITVKNDG